MAQTPRASILVVDDEEEILHSLHRLLRTEFDVHTARSGPEALQILKQQPLHVVLSDQRTPEMEGVELLSQAQGERPRAIRVMFTGYTDLQAVIEAINQGQIFRYLAKPWEPDELLAMVRQACEEYERRDENGKFSTARGPKPPCSRPRKRPKRPAGPRASSWPT